ncbi:hypothetical protein N9059_00930 [bacterium]|nr:hypothetical protein [bacterium]
MSELINFDCPKCGQNIDAPPEMAGIEFPCPSCKDSLKIPEKSTNPDGSGAAPSKVKVVSLRKKCGSCGDMCDAEAVICIECGYRFNSTDGDSGKDDNLLDTAEDYIGRAAFRLSNDGWFNVPVDSEDEQQIGFLAQLDSGREAGEELRIQFKTIQPLVEQEFDPLDTPLKDYFSLAVMFNRDFLGEEVAKELMMIFLNRVKPDCFRQKVGLHAGPMIGFQNLAAVVVRGPNARDMLHVAQAFGPGLEPDYLLPHNLRFVCANSDDGNLIQRTFSIVHELTLSGGIIIPAAQSVAAKKLEEGELKVSGWQLGMGS